MAEEREPEPEKTFELSTPEGHQYALLTLFTDGHVTFCLAPESTATPAFAEEVAKALEAVVCRTTRRPEGSGFFHSLKWFLEQAVPGATVREL